ncbi:hypothetical protein Scep_015784 [Stephania cephalantha]|uniref:Dof zinc finger protein n=1 Tax=Stephania cephalantha TaxID=152367 RepID=A0AAP0P1L6_9MAGN
MVFSSVPPYLDPSNWHQQPPPNLNHHHAHHHHHHHQQQQQQQGGENDNNNNNNNPPSLHHQPHHHHQQQQQQQQQQQIPGPASGVGSGGIRPGSMADRARMAKLPQPESALKCPRCDSTNTKFCYFNNYSLSQPRHFCKTCRRYWTRGGALRNVPVGGGCRRNKRSKGSRSKSPVTGERQKGGTSSSSISSLPPPPPNANLFMTTDIISHHHHQLPFMASLHHHLTTDQYGNPGTDHMGLNYGGIQSHMAQTGGGGAPDIDFQIGSNSGGGGGGNISGTILSSSGGMTTSSPHDQQQWRTTLQQFPFLAPGLDTQAGGLYPIDQGEGGGGVEPGAVQGFSLLRGRPTAASLVSQLASVKMEDSNSSGLNLSRQILGIPTGTITTHDQNQFWNGNAWTDLSTFSSSSTSPLL